METKGKVKKKARKLPPNNQNEDRALSPHSEQHEIQNQTRAKFDELLKSALEQNESDTGKGPKKKKKARAQTADAMLESLRKGGDLQKSSREDATTLNNTFNAEDSPRYTKNTTNARRKKLPPKKGNTNKGFVNDDGMEMDEMGVEEEDDAGGVKKKKKKKKKPLNVDGEEETHIDGTMTLSELEHTPKKPRRRKTRTAEPGEDEEDGVSKATIDEEENGGAEEGTPRAKGKKKKKKKKSTTVPLPADDGRILGVTVHRSDRLKPDLYIAHPLVRIHVVDASTGAYVKKSSRDRPVTSYYETQNENLDYILPILTQPFDFKKRKSMTPNWEEDIKFNESYNFLIQSRDDWPQVILFFEVLDFVSMNIASTRPQLLKAQGTWHRIAWGFLKLVGSNGAPNTEKKVRLQLFYPPFAFKAKPGQLDVFQWWESMRRQPYPATLYVTVRPIQPPDEINPATRSLFATQEERGLMTYKELKETMSMRNKDQTKKTNMPTIWTKLPGQTCRIPNKEILSLAGEKKGCHVIKFSPDGHHIACGCKDKEGYPILVFEIPSGKLKGQFPGHYGLIYDLCWSPKASAILTASSDGTARIWHLDSPESTALKVFPHPSFVYVARYHPKDDSYIITGGYDNILRVWSLESNGQTGELLYELEGHQGYINTMAFTPDGSKMYTGDSLGVIIIWKSAGADGNWMMGQEVKERDLQGVSINCLTVHPSGRRLLVHTRDNNVRMLDLRLFCVMQQYGGLLNFREQIRSTLSPCGSFVFSGSEDRHGYVWNTDTGQQIAAYTKLGYRQPVCDIDYHPHEHMVALCSRGEGHPVHVYVYDAKVAQLSMGFSRLKGGAEKAEEEAATMEEERLVGTLRAKQELDQNLEEKKQERLARVRSKLSAVLAMKEVLKTIQNTPQEPNKTLMNASYAPGATSMYETWGSTFDYSQAGWQSQTQGAYGSSLAGSLGGALGGTPGGTLGMTGGRGGPGWTSTPYKKGPMPSINLATESDGKAIFTFKPPVVGEKQAPLAKPVVALYDYTAQRSDELNLRRGDQITVLHRDNENWWMGQLAGGQQGYFPANYVSYEGEEEDQTAQAARYYQQTGADETDSPRRSKAKGQGGTPQRRAKDTFTAVTTKSGELKFLSGAEDSHSEMEPLSNTTTPRRRKKKKTVTMSATLDYADAATDGDSPHGGGRPPKGHSRSRTTPNLTKSAELNDSQTPGGKKTPRRKRLNMDEASNVEDSGNEATTPRSARLRRGSRENLLQLDPGSTGRKGGGKRKTKTKHLYDDNESVA